LSLGKIR